MLSEIGVNRVLINENQTKRKILQYSDKVADWRPLFNGTVKDTPSVVHEILWIVKMHNNPGPTHFSLTVSCYLRQPSNIAREVCMYWAHRVTIGPTSPSNG